MRMLLFDRIFLKIFLGKTAQAIGAVFFVVQTYEAFQHTKIEISYLEFLSISLISGIIWCVIDGYFFSGYLRREIKISSNSFDTEIVVAFGDIFEQDGWIAIGVNDFFDSKIDEKHISKTTLHGKMLTKYWGDDAKDWERKTASDIKNQGEEVTRKTGRNTRYKIGTTAAVKSNNGSMFLCTSLARTDISTLEVKTSLSDLLNALNGLLVKARSECHLKPLNIPLLGSGLGRVGMKPSIHIELILSAIFEETKRNKVTDTIRIILPLEMRSKINLVSIKQKWS